MSPIFVTLVSCVSFELSLSYVYDNAKQAGVFPKLAVKTRVLLTLRTTLLLLGFLESFGTIGKTIYLDPVDMRRTLSKIC
jgi:hypothetical protein